MGKRAHDKVLEIQIEHEKEQLLAFFFFLSVTISGKRVELDIAMRKHSKCNKHQLVSLYDWYVNVSTVLRRTRVSGFPI